MYSIYCPKGLSLNIPTVSLIFFLFYIVTWYQSYGCSRSSPPPSIQRCAAPGSIDLAPGGSISIKPQTHFPSQLSPSSSREQRTRRRLHLRADPPVAVVRRRRALSRAAACQAAVEALLCPPSRPPSRTRPPRRPSRPSSSSIAPDLQRERPATTRPRPSPPARPPLHRPSPPARPCAAAVLHPRDRPPVADAAAGPHPCPSCGARPPRLSRGCRPLRPSPSSGRRGSGRFVPPPPAGPVAAPFLTARTARPHRRRGLSPPLSARPSVCPSQRPRGQVLCFVGALFCQVP